MENYITELKFQEACWRWYHNSYGRFDHYGRLFRVKNELDAHANAQSRQRQLAENRGTGIVPGVADFGFIIDVNMVWIELKLPNGVQSQEQKVWQQLVLRSGMLYFVVRTMDEFQQIIKTYI